MKSKWKITVASAGLVLTLLLSACQSAAPGQTPSAPSAATLANYINIDDARNAALQAASVTDSDVSVERVWLSGEGDTALYSVQFASPEGALYQYDVNAVTGEAKAVEPVDYERQKQEAALEREAEATALGASAQPSASSQPAASASDIPAASQPAASLGEITLERAKEIALNNAGVKAADATFIETKLDYEGFRKVYDIEFVTLSGGAYKEYDYEIAVSDGTIVGYDFDVEGYIDPAVAQPGNSQTATDIGVDKAKEIALNHASVKAADATFVKAKPDYDDGRLVYEIEFIAVSNGTAKEYDYEILASDDTIVSYDYDVETKYTVPSGNTQTGTTQTAGYIGVEKAKEIALNHAGVKAADATFVETKRDYENGRLVYEIEFIVVSNGTAKEYDYEVAASDGTIVSYDYDVEASYTVPSGNTQPGGTQTASDIGLDKAKEIALTHAGIKAADATFIEAKRDYDDGRLVYELEFIVISNGTAKEYDYEVAASDGTIVSYDYDIEASYTVPSGNTQTTGTLAEADAKALALAQVAGATADNIYKWKKDYDDGRWIYEGKIVYNGWEYEFEMDASTGAFLEWDIESVFD